MTGASYGDTETLDLKTASGLMKILHGGFRKRVLKEDEKAQQNSRFMMD